MKSEEGNIKVHQSQDSMLWLAFVLQQCNVCSQDTAETVSEQDNIQIFSFVR